MKILNKRKLYLINKKMGINEEFTNMEDFNNYLISHHITENKDYSKEGFYNNEDSLIINLDYNHFKFSLGLTDKVIKKRKIKENDTIEFLELGERIYLIIINRGLESERYLTSKYNNKYHCMVIRKPSLASIDNFHKSIRIRISKDFVLSIDTINKRLDAQLDNRKELVEE